MDLGPPFGGDDPFFFVDSVIVCESHRYTPSCLRLSAIACSAVQFIFTQCTSVHFTFLYHLALRCKIGSFSITPAPAAGIYLVLILILCVG
ncbi:hypothetical protein BDW75DRAFT_195837 [Aspergillus navahoensis]